jgi:hypothetical protein
MHWIEELFHQTMRLVERLDRGEWVLVLAGVVLVGWICLRGFGSRSSY